jgi:soluble lytic murein transglycosylase
LKENFPDSIYMFASMYWEGRCLEAMGKPEVAREKYLDLVEQNTHGYYRLLALGRLASMDPRPPDGLFESKVPLVYRPDAETAESNGSQWKVSIQRINSFMELRLDEDGDNEIACLLNVHGDNREVHRSLARLYNSRGRYFDAIVALRKGYPALSRTGLPPGEWRILYPLRYWETISGHATAYKLDPFLVAAVIRQESIFNARAVSSAKALGVMQIIPSTGQWLSRRLALKGFTWRDLFDPEVNIHMGTYYLSMLQEEHKGNIINSLSAYNAGNGRISKWRKSIRGVDDEEFVESIPFRETAWYVKNITLFKEAYEKLYGSLY